MGKVCAYYVSADWSNTRINKPYRVPAFNVNDRTSANQILYTGLYSPNMNSYFTPDYLAGNNWSLIDQKVSEYHLNAISSGFSGSYVFNFANGVPSQEERFQIENSLQEKFMGSEKLVNLYSRSAKIEIEYQILHQYKWLIWINNI